MGAVTDTDTDANEIAEDAVAGTPVQITASATDPDVTDTVSYSLAAGVLDNDLFQIDGTSGVVTLKGSLDAETSSSHTIEVTATSTDGDVILRYLTGTGAGA